MKIAILGCGPTGLLAAHACYLEGHEFDIFSKKRKSELFGSQYLHNPIPGLQVHPVSGVPVKYVTLGTPEEYRRKVHGKWWDGHVGANEFEPDHTAWDIRQAYDMLWNLYWRKIQDYEIPVYPQEWSSPKGSYPPYVVFLRVSAELKLEEYDLVISTVPRDIWKIPGEEFIFSEGWALGDAPERGIFVEDMIPEVKEEWGYIGDNQIICDGTAETSWTRLSRVYGYTTIEWPHHVPRPHPLASRVRKPLHYTPVSQTANPTHRWLHVGRYGQFEKGVVVTDAFDQVVKKLKEMK